MGLLKGKNKQDILRLLDGLSFVDTLDKLNNLNIDKYKILTDDYIIENLLLVDNVYNKVFICHHYSLRLNFYPSIREIYNFIGKSYNNYNKKFRDIINGKNISVSRITDEDKYIQNIG